MIEHQAALRLVDDTAATDVAVRNGSFTAPQTWRDRVVPPSGARILIPAGVNVTLASSLLERRYEWIRVDGGLQFAGDRDTGLKVVTLVVGENGRLASDARTTGCALTSGRSSNLPIEAPVTAKRIHWTWAADSSCSARSRFTARA
jgi:hypothetical protein